MVYILYILFSVAEECVADLVFVVDNSQSIRQYQQQGVDNWQRVKDFMKNVVNDFVIGLNNVRVAVITFSDSATVGYHTCIRKL